MSQRYPCLSDLAAGAQRRIPRFVWEYLDSATGDETTKHRNRAALDAVRLMPSILHGPITFDTSVRLLGETHPLPFGAAPVGMSGMIWPHAERHIARAATEARLPYGVSTVACAAPEDLKDCVGGKGWFQLYPPKDVDIRKDMLKRARNAGFHTLVLTVDVPVASRRERQTRSGLTQPPRLTPRLLAQIAMRPAWAMEMAKAGRPGMPLVESYGDNRKGLPPTAHIGYLLRTSPDWDYVKWLRDHWKGALVIKGVLDAREVPRLEAAGVDAIWVSNHSGRQFDAAPASIEVLPAIRAATHLPVIFDSGVNGGLDMLRAIALGADFIMLGRAWHYALAALGPEGLPYMIEMFKKDLEANMGQLGATKLTDVRKTLIDPPLG